MIALSIIIVSYRSWNRLDACLKSIVTQVMDDIEVIVVDNHSNDGKAGQFISLHPQVRFVLQDTNAGFAQACNRGAKEAKGNWLLFLNPDTVLQPNTLAPLLDKVANEPSWKLIGIRQLNDQGKDTHPHGLFLKWWNVWAPVRSLERMIKGSKFSKEYLTNAPVSYPDWISGSFVLISKNDLEELGGWDERFWMYCEDMDLSKRAAEKGGNGFFTMSWFVPIPMEDLLGSILKQKPSQNLLLSFQQSNTSKNTTGHFFGLAMDIFV